jgi:hypothetical protein
MPVSASTFSRFGEPDPRRQEASASAGPSRYMLLGLGLATWMGLYTCDGMSLVLPTARAKRRSAKKSPELVKYNQSDPPYRIVRTRHKRVGDAYE